MKRRSFLHNLAGIVGLTAIGLGLDYGTESASGPHPDDIKNAEPRALIEILYPFANIAPSVQPAAITISQRDGASFPMMTGPDQFHPDFLQMLFFKKDGTFPSADEQQRNKFRHNPYPAVPHPDDHFHLATLPYAVHEVALCDLLDIIRPTTPPDIVQNIEETYQDIWVNHPENFLRKNAEITFHCRDTRVAPHFTWRRKHETDVKTYTISEDALQKLEICRIGSYHETESRLYYGQAEKIIHTEEDHHHAPQSAFTIPHGVMLSIGDQEWSTNVVHKNTHKTWRLHEPQNSPFDRLDEQKKTLFYRHVKKHLKDNPSPW
jgi:hypothetical protein